MKDHEKTAQQIVDMVVLDGEGAAVRLVRKIAAALQEVENQHLMPRHISWWHEDIGPVLWWTFPITEAPYVGSPLDCGHAVEMRHYIGGEGEVKTVRTNVGGWPGYHEWWTPLPTNKQAELIEERIKAAQGQPKEQVA